MVPVSGAWSLFITLLEGFLVFLGFGFSSNSPLAYTTDSGTRAMVEHCGGTVSKAQGLRDYWNISTYRK